MSLVTVPSLGSLGVYYDQLAQELPDSALTDAVNVRMRNGSAERMRGELEVFGTPSATPYGMFLYAQGGARYVVHAGTASVYVNDGSTSTDITGTAPTGGADDRWTGGSIGGVLVLNNGVDAPMYWGGNTASNLATLSNWPASTTCASMRPWKNYLFALDVTKSGTRYPHLVKWSSAAEPGALPGSWDETDPANDAGEFDLAETTDFIVDALPLGDSLIVYKEASAYAITYIGGQYVFSSRRLPADVGMLARGCAVSIPAGHVVLTPGDLVLTNGFEVRSIADSRTREWLFDTMDATNAGRSFLVSHTTYNEVWVCFPESGETTCTKALVWNWKDDTFTTRDLNNVTCGVNGVIPSTVDNSIDGDTGAIDDDTTAIDYVEGGSNQAQFVIGTTAPDIRLVDSGADFAGTDFTSRIERNHIAFGKPANVKTVRAVYPRIEGASGQTVYIQFGYTMDVETPVTWETAITYTVGTSYKADTLVTGRFISYRIWSESGAAWRLKSIDFDVEIGGLF